MSKYRMIDTRFWSDAYISNLDPMEKGVFLYCLSNDCTNIAGIYEMNMNKMAVETGYEKQMLRKVLERFANDRKIYYIEDHIVIVNFLNYQKLGWKTELGVMKIIEALPKRLRKFIVLDDKGLWLDVAETKGDLAIMSENITTAWLKRMQKEHGAKFKK